MRTLVSRHYGLRRSRSCSPRSARTSSLRRAMHAGLAARRSRTRARSARWERAAHIGWEEPLQQAFLRVPDLVEAMNVFYLAGHFAAHGRLLRLALPPLARRRSGSSATASSPRPRSRSPSHWRFPTAPPRLAGLGLVDTLRRLSGHRHRLARVVGLLQPGRRRAVAARRLGARRRPRPRALRAAARLEGGRRALSARRRADDPRRPATTSSSTRSPGMAVMALGLRRRGVLFGRDGAKIVPATRGGAVR